MSELVVRAALPTDADSARYLGSRLSEGAAPWRPRAEFATAAQGWSDDSLSGLDEAHPGWIAEEDGIIVGVATACLRPHFSGQLDCYLGELAVAVGKEGHGIGRRLVAAVERWAVERGVLRVTLETGAANRRARDFYAVLGNVEEQVQLTRVLALASVPGSRNAASCRARRQ
jgi:GNAT superfamily N-acetyltransferase